MTVEIDGKEKRLPLEMTLSEYMKMYEEAGITFSINDKGEMVFDEMDTSAVYGLYVGFANFAAKYLGKEIKDVGNDTIQALKKAWDDKRTEVLGIDMGEQSRLQQS